MVTNACRVSPTCEAMATSTTPGPMPLVGETRSQLSLADAVHEQPPGVVTCTGAVSPVLFERRVVTLTEYVHSTAGTVICRMRKVWELTVTVTVRVSDPTFSLKLNFTSRLPVPDVGDTSAQVESTRAVHEHPAGALIVNMLSPSFDPIVAGSPFTEDTHPADPLEGAGASEGPVGEAVSLEHAPTATAIPRISGRKFCRLMPQLYCRLIAN